VSHDRERRLDADEASVVGRERCTREPGHGAAPVARRPCRRHAFVADQDGAAFDGRDARARADGDAASLGLEPDASCGTRRVVGQDLILGREDRERRGDAAREEARPEREAELDARGAAAHDRDVETVLRSRDVRVQPVDPVADRSRREGVLAHAGQVQAADRSAHVEARDVVGTSVRRRGRSVARPGRCRPRVRVPRGAGAAPEVGGVDLELVRA